MPDKAIDRNVPVETPVGTLYGRDAIYLDEVRYDRASLTIKGKFNGKLASKPTNEWISYSITFIGVIALEVLELDSWENLEERGWSRYASSFDEIVERFVYTRPLSRVL